MKKGTPPPDLIKNNVPFPAGEGTGLGFLLFNRWMTQLLFNRFHDLIQAQFDIFISELQHVKVFSDGWVLKIRRDKRKTTPNPSLYQGGEHKLFFLARLSNDKSQGKSRNSCDQATFCLLTYFALYDHNGATMKGVLLSRLPDAQIIDINHNVEPQYVRAAAYELLSTHSYQPLESVFICVVDPE